jgi:UDP-GlcNAc:undecaprenyl-phosphate GlcNAc-1-phosphate transferase
LPLEARLLVGLATALLVAHLATPLAIKIADRYQFYDRPVGYKGHDAPTPYLGGAAVVAGFLVAVLAMGGSWDRTLPLVGGVVAMWAVGTIDDRRTLPPVSRVAAELGLAVLLWALGLGWDLGAGPALDLLATAFWIVAVVNAFNLFDNMDGAASSMAAVVAGGLAVLGVVQGDTWLAVVAAALCGATVGFLPHNLFASPAKIFLGDGGSMPVGFAVAALAMMGVSGSAPAWQSLAMGLLFVGIPAMDTALVMVSRRRRKISILTGGRDHLTHRARNRLITARAVAVALGGAQAVISGLAVIALRGGEAPVLVAVAAYLTGLGVAITVLDGRFAPDPPVAVAAPATLTAPRQARDWPAIVLLTPIALGLGLSPFFSGYYDATIWAPIGLGLLGVATASLIARPPVVGPAAGLLLAGLAGLAIWSLLSSLWSDSIAQAVVAGNRWLVYLALAIIVLTLVRNRRTGIALLGIVCAGAIAVGLIVVARMLGSSVGDLFVVGRLDAPLGYINGLAAFFLISLWPCVAAAEQRRSALLAGAGVAAAAMFACLVMLSQSRGVAIAAALSAVAALVVAPGRVRRGWALLVIGAAAAVAAPTLLHVYAATPAGGDPPADAVNAAGRAILLAAIAAGLVWWAATAAAERVSARLPEAAAIAASVLVLVLLGAAGLGAMSAGRVVDTVSRQYSAFVHLSEPQGTSASTGASRLVTGAGNRYDYWRVAWLAWRERPLLGVGAGNYEESYFRERGTGEDVRQPHSVGLQTLSELGIAGGAILLTLLAGIGLGALRVARTARTSAAARAILVAGVGSATAWVAHTSVDWIHLLPGVTGLAIVGAVLLVCDPVPLVANAPRRTATAASARRQQIAVACAAIAIIVAAASLSRQVLTDHFQSRAARSLTQDPATALREADRALRLDREAVGAYYVKAAAFARFNQPDAARAALREAARREPGDFVTWALLGDLAVRTGDFGQARRMYARASLLNPLDTTLRRLAQDPRSAA